MFLKNKKLLTNATEERYNVPKEHKEVNVMEYLEETEKISAKEFYELIKNLSEDERKKLYYLIIGMQLSSE